MFVRNRTTSVRNRANRWGPPLRMLVFFYMRLEKIWCAEEILFYDIGLDGLDKKVAGPGLCLLQTDILFRVEFLI